LRLHLLDTNICVYALKGTHPSIRDHVQSSEPDMVGIPSVVLAELLTGAAKSRRPERTLDTVRRFVAPLRVVAFDAIAAEHYARVRAALESSGNPIGPNDLIVAATALAAQAILITHDTREFERVPGLVCEDWTKPLPGA
jgi:tRNA(fMet)-specific endonuclease VapC